MSRQRTRQGSRDLRQRTPTLPFHAPRDVQTLLRAEADLEAAIGKCRDALDEVRRELRCQEAVPSRVVH